MVLIKPCGMLLSIGYLGVRISDLAWLRSQPNWEIGMQVQIGPSHRVMSFLLLALLPCAGLGESAAGLLMATAANADTTSSHTANEAADESADRTPKIETIEIAGYECQKYSVVSDMGNGQESTQYMWVTNEIALERPKKIAKCGSLFADALIRKKVVDIHELRLVQEVRDLKQEVYRAKRALQRQYMAALQRRKAKKHPGEAEEIRHAEKALRQRQACFNDLFREAKIVSKNATGNQRIHIPACDYIR